MRKRSVRTHRAMSARADLPCLAGAVRTRLAARARRLFAQALIADRGQQ
jgi:hypothetical protein